MKNNLIKIKLGDLIDLNLDNDLSKYIRKKIAEYLNLDKLEFENIIFTNGADAAIHAISLAFFKNKKISYLNLNYQYATNLINKKTSSSKEIETTWDIRKGKCKIKNILEHTNLVYITNPDNRLGLCINKKDVKNLIIKMARQNTMCIVDESYMDFVPEQSVCKYTLPKTIIIRTFSKFFSLSSYRIAYIIGDAEIIQTLKEYIPQFPIATSSIINLVKKISITKKDKQNQLKKNDVKKERFYKFCHENNIPYIRSNTNFITIHTNPKKIRGIKIEHRNIKKFIAKNKECFRILMDDVKY